MVEVLADWQAVDKQNNRKTSFFFFFLSLFLISSFLICRDKGKGPFSDSLILYKGIIVTEMQKSI